MPSMPPSTSHRGPRDPSLLRRSGGRLRRGAGIRALLVALLLGASGCAINPATGTRQLSLIGTDQEVQMGREYDPQILAEMGVYPDSAIQRYLRSIGEPMARSSERPDLPWTFRVVDDPLVNAFAVPGGFIYITRGIMAHLNSEAELAGIVGHEIGHVTARHSVNQMSRQQLAQLGLGVGMILRPELAEFGQLAGAGLQLLFLKYGRDAEYQSDDLGVRYMRRAGYDPRQLAAVFQTLGALSGDAEGGRPPEWASTHPFAENRVQRVLSSVQGEDLSGLRVVDEPYIQRLDGMVFGENPREGFFRGSTFHHPDLAFRLDFPSGWQTHNGKTAVQAISREQDALITLDIAPQESATRARAAFLSGEGIQAGRTAERRVDGLPSAWSEFAAQTQNGVIQGVVGFVEHGGLVYRLLGYGTQAGWRARGDATTRALESFRREGDRSVLNVQPARLEIVRIPSAMTLREFEGRYPSTVPIETIALINGIHDGGARLEGGRLMKRVVGGVAP